MNRNRRKFLKQTSQYALGFGLLGFTGSLTACGGGAESENTAEDDPSLKTTTPMFFKISLAQWSLHKTIRDEKALDNLDFAAKARNDFGIEAVEYVNQFFFDKATDQQYLAEMKKRADDHGVRSLLIMIDREGNLGAVDQKERAEAVDNHYKWIDAAKFLGCHSIRVNAYGEGSAEEVQKNAIDSLGTLGEYAAQENINVIVENHGSYSSNGQWLATVMKTVGMDNVGTLPDFGNFCIERAEGSWDCVKEYDRYKGVREMMPFAKGVSAKTNVFDENGNEANIDYFKMMQIVKEAGYTGYVGIEYEGNELSEEEGIRATKELLQRVGQQMS